MLSDDYFATLVRDLRAHLADVEAMIGFASKLAGTTITPPAARPRVAKPDRAALPKMTTRAIEAVLSSDGPLRQRDIIERLQDRGWSTTAKNVGANVGATLSFMSKTGRLRRLGTNGSSVYALAKAPEHATRKLAAAVARVETQPQPTPRRPRRRRVRSRSAGDVTLTDLIKGELANSDGLTTRQLTDRLLASGWRTSSSKPTDIVRHALTDMGDAVVASKDDAQSGHVFRLREAPPASSRRRASTPPDHPAATPE